MSYQLEQPLFVVRDKGTRLFLPPVARGESATHKHLRDNPRLFTSRGAAIRAANAWQGGPQEHFINNEGEVECAVLSQHHHRDKYELEILECSITVNHVHDLGEINAEQAQRQAS